MDIPRMHLTNVYETKQGKFFGKQTTYDDEGCCNGLSYEDKDKPLGDDHIPKDRAFFSEQGKPINALLIDKDTDLNYFFKVSEF